MQMRSSKSYRSYIAMVVSKKQFFIMQKTKCHVPCQFTKELDHQNESKETDFSIGIAIFHHDSQIMKSLNKI